MGQTIRHESYIACNHCHGDVLVKLFQEYLEVEEFEEKPDIDEEIDEGLDFAERKEYSRYDKPTSEGVIIGVIYIYEEPKCVRYGNIKRKADSTSLSISSFCEIVQSGNKIPLLHW